MQSEATEVWTKQRARLIFELCRMCLGSMLPVHALSAMGTITVPITPLPGPLYFGVCRVGWIPEEITSVLCLKTICNHAASCEMQP